jgi:hypothetical protein
VAVTGGGAGAMRPVRGGSGGVAVTPSGRLAPVAPTIEVRVWGYLRATAATTSSDKSGYRRCLGAVGDGEVAGAPSLPRVAGGGGRGRRRQRRELQARG